MSILEEFKSNNDLVEKVEVKISIEKDIEAGIEEAVKNIEYFADWAYDDLGGKEAYINTLSDAIILLHSKIKKIKEV